MFQSSSRRSFLKSAATGSGLMGLGSLAGLDHLLAEDENVIKPRNWAFRYDDQIERIVRLIEDTPLDKCVEQMAVRLRGGLSYRQFLAALYLAGLRNGNDFGYYHCIYVLHAANDLGLDAPVDERFMSLFGSLGIFKSWQRQRYSGDGHFGWRKRPTKLPQADKALARFHEASSNADPDAAEAAIITLGRTVGWRHLFDLIAPYAMVDVHEWICLSNCFRILPVIGWQHAESTLRMMARNYSSTQPWHASWFRLRRDAAERKFGPLPSGWVDSKGNKAATLDFISALRESTPNSAFELTWKQLATGKIRAGSIWDAIHLVAAEQFSRSFGNGDELHQNTGMNALHYAFRASRGSEQRLIALMRAVTWTAQPWAVGRNLKESQMLANIEPADIPPLPRIAAEEILNSSAKDENAIGKAYAFSMQHPNASVLKEAQRQHVFETGGDSHAYKYLAAIQENSRQVSPEWRAHVFASSVAGYRGKQPTSNPMILRAREALRGA